MTTSQGPVTGFDVNKRKGRFSFVSNENRCIWVGLALSRTVEWWFLFWGFPHSPQVSLLGNPSLSNSPHVMSREVALLQRLFIFPYHPGSSCFFLRMVLWMREPKGKMSPQLESLLSHRVSLSLSKPGVILEVEKNLLTHQYLYLMPETSSKWVANQLGSILFSS